MLLLVGGSLAFAGQALDPTRTSPASTRPVPLPPAPTVLGPPGGLTRAESIDLTIVVPAGLRLDQQYRVRVYVNGELVRERRLPDDAEFALSGVPLTEGANGVRAALVGGGGQGELSPEVSIVRDSTAPLIHVSQPQSGATVYAPVATLRGRTEAGADISIVDGATGEELATESEPDGRFVAELALAPGNNSYLLRSRDAAGNQARARIVVSRADSSARLRLDISASELLVAELPAEIEMLALVRDELGQPVEGADVTFSLSPPNAATRTYRTATVGGLATWPDLELIDSGNVTGTWLVTVRAVLPSGAELREDRSFSVQ